MTLTAADLRIECHQGLAQDVARGRRDTREGPEKTEELKMDRHHPTQRLAEPWNNPAPGILNRRKLRKRATAVGIERYDATLASVVLRDGHVIPSRIVVDRVWSHGFEIHEQYATDARTGRHACPEAPATLPRAKMLANERHE